MWIENIAEKETCHMWVHWWQKLVVKFRIGDGVYSFLVRKNDFTCVSSIGEGQEFGNIVPPFIDLEFGCMLILLLEM